MKKLKDWSRRLVHSRIPLCILFIGVACVIVFLVCKGDAYNVDANRVLVHRHTERVANIHRDNNKIFKYRSQEEALGDEHMLYIIHHPKLKNHPQYIKLTNSMMKTNDTDDGYINELTMNANHNRKAIKSDKPHGLTYNALLNPHRGKVFNELITTGASLGLLVIIDLVVLVRIAKFKDDLKYEDLEG